jgi:hypothetical protein
MRGFAWAALLAGLAAPAGAEGPRRQLTETLGLAVNNLGLQNTLELSWQWPLHPDAGPLLREAQVSLGISNSVSPSYLRLGGWVSYAPVSILEVRAGIEPVYYLGIAGSLLAFERIDADFGAAARKARRGDAVGAWGLRVSVAPSLRLELGRVLATSGLELERWKAEDLGPFVYEPTRDTLLSPSGAWLLNGNSVLLWKADPNPKRRILAGLRHAFTDARSAGSSARSSRSASWPGAENAGTRSRTRSGRGRPALSRSGPSSV